MAQARDSVSDFEAVAQQLIGECLAYANAGVYDPDTNRNIARVRNQASLLNTALQIANSVPRPRTPPL